MKFAILLLVLATTGPGAFVFEDRGHSIEGYVAGPKNPKALMLYFHRGIEDRTAVLEWAKLLGPHGYAVAGYTATPATNIVEQARSGLHSLRTRAEFAHLPVIVMGASLGTVAAAELFAAEKNIRGLALLVPGAPDRQCAILKQTAGRHILLIQAEHDDIVSPESAAKIKGCLPTTAGYFLLKGASHRFPPSEVAPEILEWLNHIVQTPS